MIVAQGLTSLAVWLAYEWLLCRRIARCRFAPRGPRWLTALAGGGLLIGAAAVLLGGLTLIQHAGGFGSTGMRAWAWAATTLLGLVFVHGQTLAAVLTLSLIDVGNTERPSESSKIQEEEH